ncbi:MAG: TonB family protein [Saprospiraceae bacterium]|nr:TonB family protein [Saprospiraceae bacterium]MCF8248343.1 TonB family protein [Saprospiraceae bacterium]MCF8280218.1 TonB family protein [Bacteroidales bacterium]MCF8309871.1 TonB family protein [Saprospiraceae bacterium]MCF8438798.1 TonB family protein [Saprospiraceae bacterium]
MDFEISGSIVMLISILIVLLTIALIIVVKGVYKKRSESNLTAKHAGTTFSSPLEGRNKYPEVDTFSLGTTFRNFGILAAIILMILAFSWTKYDRVIDVSGLLGTLDEEIEMETPRTAEPPPPPPPPPPVIQEVPDDISVETVIQQDQSIEEETQVIAPPVIEKAPPPPPPPPPPKEEEEEIFKVVEDQPAFPGCEDISDKTEKKKCAETKMLQFIYSNIKYPPIARENGVEGTVYVKFVVEKDGSITLPEVVRDIGAGCGDEALRVVKLMPKWQPGKQRGRAVRVQFNLPVKYKLE